MLLIVREDRYYLTNFERTVIELNASITALLVQLMLTSLKEPAARSNKSNATIVVATSA